MKPFKLTPAQARQQKRDLDTKDRIVLDNTRAMTKVLEGAVNQVYDNLVQTGKYKEPDLSAIDKIGREFYRKIVMAAVHSSQAQAKNKKRLASQPADPALPNGPDALRRVLRDKKYWQKIYARADKLFGRQKKEYLANLKKQFKKIVPTLDIGDMAPREVKKQLAEAWKAPRARVETIFRTETTNYFAKAQVAYFEDSNYIIGFLFNSVRDTSRTKICQSRHGLVYRPKTALLEENSPPCHYNCRSHLVPLVDDPENRKMLEDPRRDPEKVKVVPFLPGWRP